jgi:hypothetical protein
MPGKVGVTEYFFNVISGNKPMDELLAVRFNWKTSEWESSWIIAREIKLPHYNPKTKMAEGLTSKVLEKQGWNATHVTTVDPKTIKTIP